MAFNLKERTLSRQKVDISSRFASEYLDASTTQEIVKLGISAAKVSFQSTDTLAGTISFSINGADFFDSTAFAAKTPGSYTTHNVTLIKIIRTGGAGRMMIAAS